MTNHPDALHQARCRTIERLFAQSLIEKDLDGSMTYFTRDFVLRMPIVSIPRGPRGWTAAIRFFLGGLAPLSARLVDGFGDGAMLATRLLISGEHRGPLGVHAATGRSFRATALASWRFRGPLIAEAHVEVDALRIVQDLGLGELVATAGPFHA